MKLGRIVLLFIGLLTTNYVNAQYTKLLNFGSPANIGSFPRGSLISDGTFLYAMTASGGSYNKGTIFKIKPDGTGYVKLLDFDGTSNGSAPYNSLILIDAFLYGTTSSGGIYDKGTIFKIKPDGTGFVKIIDFAGVSNGDSPVGPLIFDGTYLYGMTTYGGNYNKGTAFKIKPDGTGYVKLILFVGTSNGGEPQGSFVSDGTFLYGTTSVGGTYAYGTIFKIKLDGTGYLKLIDFSGLTNGINPYYGSLISDGTFLYGTTRLGGTDDKGTIFKIKPDGTGFVKLIDFVGASNGSNPYGSLIFDGNFLYGMTDMGGNNNYGVMFKVRPDGTGFVKLIDFDYLTSGNSPLGSLIYDGNCLYGMTSGGGAMGGGGTIFKYQYNVTTNVGVNNSVQDFRIYPNPNNGDFIVKSITEGSYKLINNIGQTINSFQLTTDNNFTTTIEQLPQGIYTIVGKENNQLVNQKIIVIK